jgi:hypothetical protein
MKIKYYTDHDNKDTNVEDATKAKRFTAPEWPEVSQRTEDQKNRPKIPPCGGKCVQRYKCFWCAPYVKLPRRRR